MRSSLRLMGVQCSAECHSPAEASATRAERVAEGAAATGEAPSEDYQAIA